MIKHQIYFARFDISDHPLLPVPPIKFYLSAIGKYSLEIYFYEFKKAFHLRIYPHRTLAKSL